MMALIGLVQGIAPLTERHPGQRVRQGVDERRLSKNGPDMRENLIESLTLGGGRHGVALQ